jgi:ATP-dependent RNA helicase MSS116, mitochondrial
MACRLGRYVGHQQYRCAYPIQKSMVFDKNILRNTFFFDRHLIGGKPLLTVRNKSTNSLFVTFSDHQNASFKEMFPMNSMKQHMLTLKLDKLLQVHHLKCKCHRCTRVAFFSTIPEEALDAVESESTMSDTSIAGNHSIVDTVDTVLSTSSTGATDSDSQSDPGMAIDNESPPSSSQNTFEDLPNLHPVTKEAIRSMNIITMTEIQAKTWEAAISGRDVLGRSRTGSGKTLAFLVPALERILRSHTQTDKNKIKMLIISPTRELAHQIYSTTLLLTNKFGKNNNTQPIHCQVMYGGTPKIQDIQKMQKNIPTIVTSTPGRLLDHLKTTTIHGNTSFVQYIKDIDVLVLDEMDLLLDMGFRDDVQNILSFLSNSSSTSSTNNKQRQTLLFSATLPHGVKDVIRRYIRRDHVVVDCIQDSDPSSHTVSTVEQSHVILPPDKIVAGTVQTILQLMKSNMQHKIIVFFPTTSQVTYYSAVFNNGLGRRVIEIHSGISQGARTNRSDNFRHSKTASVLFTSDVSARGVDYPNVTHVLQVGAASNRETYIHRLGRTGRAGKSGQGIILLLPDEVDFIRRDLHDINIPMNSMLQNLLKMEVDGSDLENHMNRIHDLTNKSPDMKKAATDVYRNLFGYYAQRFKAMNVRNFEEALVGLVNGFAKQAGLNEMPLLPSKIVSQYRLSQHPALNVQRQWDTGSRNFDVGRGNRFSGGGRGRGGGDGFGGFRGRGNGGGRSGNYFGNFGQTRNEPPNGSMSVSTSPLPSSTDWHGYV